MFGTLVVGYLFLGGTGAGALFVLCVLEAMNARRRFGHGDGRSRLGRTYVGRAMGSLRVEGSRRAGGSSYYEGGYSAHEAASAAARYAKRGWARMFALPAEFFARAWVLCLVTLALGIVCLMADLGRPDRLFELVLHPHVSAITVGAYALVVALALAAAFSIGANFDGFPLKVGLVYVGAFLGIVAGLTTMAYTGVLLSSLASVLLWQTRLLPALFVLSSLSSGIALCFLAAPFVQTRQNLLRPLIGLANVDGFVIVAEAVVLAAFLLGGLSDAGSAASAHALMAGDLSWMFWGGVVALGLVIPFVMERLVRYGNYSTQLLYVAALILFGALLLRWCVVGAADYDVTQASNMLWELTQAAAGAAVSI